MSLIGTWKVKMVGMFDPDNGLKCVPVEEALASGDEDLAQMAAMVLKIDADGTMMTCVNLPAEIVEEAKAQGAPVTDDGMIIAEVGRYKEQDGKYYRFTGDEGEIDGVQLDGWEEISLENGLLSMMGGMVLFEKI